MLKRNKTRIKEVLLGKSAVNKSFLQSSKSGVTSQVKKGIESGANVNAINSSGFTSLHHAVMNGNLQLIQLLISQGADPNVKDNKGNTPLHTLSYTKLNDQVLNAMAHLLLTSGARVDKTNKMKQTPLHLAMKAGKINLMKIFTKAGANIHYEDMYDKTPHQYAVEYYQRKLPSSKGLDHLYKLLQSITKDIDQYNVKIRKELTDYLHSQERRKTFLQLACEKNDTNMILWLLNNKWSVNGDNDSLSPLHIACERGHLESVKLLVKFGAQIDKPYAEETPLFKACDKGYLDIVKLLVEKGANVNALYKPFNWGTHIQNYIVHKSPFNKVCEKGYLDIVKYLLSKGADIDDKENEQKPILLAFRGDHLEVVRALVEKGVDVNVQNKSGFSPLFKPY
jgi:ankyrin repeat protein